jgi:hypothetical protein
VLAEGHWAASLRDYNHLAVLGTLNELSLPDNEVTLADDRDEHDLPVARRRAARPQCDLTAGVQDPSWSFGRTR